MPRAVPTPATHMTCAKCKKTKHRDEFAVTTARGRRYRRRTCGACMLEYYRSYNRGVYVV